MNISDADLKKLWGKSAGRCSYPGCSNNCIGYFEKSGDKILGEMAHVIAQSSDGPRGTTGIGGPDTYENLILLCPYHHEMIDKAPADFPAEALYKWKHDHEARIQSSLNTPGYENLSKLAEAVDQILTENYVIWKKVGPDSELAEQNPFSAGARVWEFQKLSTVVPNNKRIAQLLHAHKMLIPSNNWPECVAFMQHSSAFEQNAYDRIDSNAVPRFPNEFETFIKKNI